MYIYICIYIYVYMYIYNIYKYIHTYISARTRVSSTASRVCMPAACSRMCAKTSSPSNVCRFGRRRRIR